MIVAGVGCRRGCPAGDIVALVQLAQDRAGCMAEVLAAPDFKQDEAGLHEAARLLGPRDDVTLVERAEAALQGADALLIVTEWKEFRTPDFDTIKSTLKAPVVFDGRNLYEPKLMKAMGIEYSGIGRS